MKKKQILVVFTGSMELGGIERSLIGLLGAIDYERYDVDLFLYGHHGPLFNLIDKRVNLLPEIKELAYLRGSFATKLKHGCFYSVYYRLIDQIVSHFKPIDNDETWAKVMRKCTPKNNKKYDLAIGFFRPFDYIAEKVDATVKVGWVHTDYSNSGKTSKAIQTDYKKVDKIAAVSDQCVSAFCKMYPEFQDRTFVIENIIPVEMIKQYANMFSVSEEMPEDGCVRILSMGRFCEAKNFDNVPDICRRIREYGLNVKWYLIGFGPDESLIKQKIDENGMQDHVIILGEKNNPYPYLNACDLYVQPSRYEGKCVSVIEAQILRKPIVITDYATSVSQLEDGIDGVIVPMNNQECAEGIIQLLNDRSKMALLSKNCGLKDYSNFAEIEKIYRIIEEK
ncbi:MAG: glycosyltransferase [Erysipelotrichaceae bacterium]|nr:glycosyltransferase [Erysipelotrichaceae bacterium]